MNKWFYCPDGEKVEKTECLFGRCRMGNRCAPLTFLQLAGRERKWEGVPSVTQLISGTRCEYLKLTTDYAIHPNKAAYRVLGTRGHTALDADNDMSFTEEHMVNDGIQGTADMVEKQPDGSWCLIDHKTTKSFKVMKAIGLVKREEPVIDEITGVQAKHKNGKPVKKTWYEIDPSQVDITDWALQTNMYRIMMEKQLGEKITSIKIFVVVRDGGTFSAKARGIDKEIYFIDVPIADDGEILAYFTEKKNALLDALANKRMPMECNGVECWDGNKCKICEVADACKQAGRSWEVENEVE